MAEFTAGHGHGRPAVGCGECACSEMATALRDALIEFHGFVRAEFDPGDDGSDDVRHYLAGWTDERLAVLTEALS